MTSSTRYRWFVVAIFFAFMLVHQMDRLMIAPMTTPIMETFQIYLNKSKQMEESGLRKMAVRTGNGSLMKRNMSMESLLILSIRADYF